MDMQAPAAHSSNVMFGCVKQSSQDINSARFVEGGRDIKYHGQMTGISFLKWLVDNMFI